MARMQNLPRQGVRASEPPPSPKATRASTSHTAISTNHYNRHNSVPPNSSQLPVAFPASLALNSKPRPDFMSEIEENESFLSTPEEPGLRPIDGATTHTTTDVITDTVVHVEATQSQPAMSTQIVPASSAVVGIPATAPSPAMPAPLAEEFARHRKHRKSDLAMSTKRRKLSHSDIGDLSPTIVLPTKRRPRADSNIYDLVPGDTDSEGREEEEVKKPAPTTKKGRRRPKKTASTKTKVSPKKTSTRRKATIAKRDPVPDMDTQTLETAAIFTATGQTQEVIFVRTSPVPTQSPLFGASVGDDSDATQVDPPDVAENPTGVRTQRELSLSEKPRIRPKFWNPPAKKKANGKVKGKLQKPALESELPSEGGNMDALLGRMTVDLLDDDLTSSMPVPSPPEVVIEAPQDKEVTEPKHIPKEKIVAQQKKKRGRPRKIRTPSPFPVEIADSESETNIPPKTPLHWDTVIQDSYAEPDGELSQPTPKALEQEEEEVDAPEEEEEEGEGQQPEEEEGDAPEEEEEEEEKEEEVLEEAEEGQQREKEGFEYQERMRNQELEVDEDEDDANAILNGRDPREQIELDIGEGTRLRIMRDCFDSEDEEDALADQPEIRKIRDALLQEANSSTRYLTHIENAYEIHRDLTELQGYTGRGQPLEQDLGYNHVLLEIIHILKTPPASDDEADVLRALEKCLEGLRSLRASDERAASLLSKLLRRQQARAANHSRLEGALCAIFKRKKHNDAHGRPFQSGVKDVDEEHEQDARRMQEKQERINREMDERINAQKQREREKAAANEEIRRRRKEEKERRRHGISKASPTNPFISSSPNMPSVAHASKPSISSPIANRQRSGYDIDADMDDFLGRPQAPPQHRLKVPPPPPEYRRPPNPLSIGRDAPVERVRVEGFGKRNPPSHRPTVPDSEILEDRPWEENEIKNMFIGLERYAQLPAGAEKWKRIIRSAGKVLRNRSVDDCELRAREIRKELVEAGFPLEPWWGDVGIES